MSQQANFFVTSAILLTSVLALPSALAQEKQKDSTPSPFLKQQTAAMDCELKRMRDELGLDEKHFTFIRESVAEALRDGVRTLEEGLPSDDSRNMKNDPTNYKGRISRVLADAIHESAAEFVDPKKFKAYRQDYEKLIAWEDCLAQKCVIVLLDNYLQLTTEQIEIINALLKTNWQHVWNDSCFQISFNGYSSCQTVIELLEKDEANPNQISKLLTFTQSEIFSQLDELGRSYDELIGESVESEAKAMTADLQWFLGRSIESLSVDQELTVKQMARVNVGFRGALKKVLQLRAENLKRYQAQGNLWFMSAVMESSFQQFRTEKIWQQTVRGLFNEGSLERWEQEETARRDRRMELGAVFGIAYLSRAWRLPHAEAVRLYEYSTKKIREQSELNLYRGTFVVFELSDQDFCELLSESTYEALTDRIASARAWKRPEVENNDEE